MKLITTAILSTVLLSSSAMASTLSVHDQLVRGFNKSLKTSGLTFKVYGKVRQSDISIAIGKVRKGARPVYKGWGLRFNEKQAVLTYVWKGEFIKPITINFKPLSTKGH